MADWTPDRLLDLVRSYQPVAVVAAAAELNLFEALTAEPLPSALLAQRLGCDPRSLTILLNALTALQLIEKREAGYSITKAVQSLLTRDGAQTLLAMVQHQANCYRRWGQLAQVVQSGRPVERSPSLRGEAGDRESFIGAMDNISAPLAEKVIHAIRPLQFRHVLDVGGASGTWTMAFLRACPAASATLFDLPPVVEMARQRLEQSGLIERVRLVAGDFMRAPLPSGADLAWVSAIVHQNSRDQNRQLFLKIFQALQPAGRIAIRDVLMDPTHTRPVAGALFAVNMLVATEGGGTFTFRELREDLNETGFVEGVVVREDDGMNSIVVATKPV